MVGQSGGPQHSSSNNNKANNDDVRPPLRPASCAPTSHLSPAPPPKARSSSLCQALRCAASKPHELRSSPTPSPVCVCGGGVGRWFFSLSIYLSSCTPSPVYTSTQCHIPSLASASKSSVTQPICGSRVTTKTDGYASVASQTPISHARTSTHAIPRLNRIAPHITTIHTQILIPPLNQHPQNTHPYLDGALRRDGLHFVIPRAADHAPAAGHRRRLLLLVLLGGGRRPAAFWAAERDDGRGKFPNDACVDSWVCLFVGLWVRGLVGCGGGAMNGISDGHDRQRDRPPRTDFNNNPHATHRR